MGVDHFVEEFFHQRQFLALAQGLHKQEALRLGAQQGLQFGIGVFFGDQQYLAALQVKVVVEAFGVEGEGQLVEVDGKRSHGEASLPRNALKPTPAARLRTAGRAVP
ncbi:hypothetical protein D3C85_652090 [compost metagenome]